MLEPGNQSICCGYVLATELRQSLGATTMAQQVVEEKGRWEEDTGLALEFLTAQVREALPAGYCIHGEPFCLSCGLQWLVARSTPTFVPAADSEQDEKALPTAC